MVPTRLVFGVVMVGMRMQPTLIERIGISDTFFRETWVLRSCACCRVVGHGSWSAMRCDRSWKALCGTARGKSRGASTLSNCAIATCLFQRVGAWASLNQGGDGGLRWVG
jgi:hypothetical protein